MQQNNNYHDVHVSHSEANNRRSVAKMILMTALIGAALVVAGMSGAHQNVLSRANMVLSNSNYVCPAGTFKNPQGSSICSLCPKGKKCLANNSGPTDCSAGMFQDIEGQDACKPCPKNTFQAKTGQSSCVSCPSGTSSDEGSTTCACTAPSGGGSLPKSTMTPIGSFDNIKNKIKAHSCGGIALSQYADSSGGHIYWNTQGCLVSSSKVIIRVGAPSSIFTVTVTSDDTMKCIWRHHDYPNNRMSKEFNGYTMRKRCTVALMGLVIKPQMENKAHPTPSMSDVITLVKTNRVCPGYIWVSTNGNSRLYFTENRYCFGHNTDIDFTTKFIGNAEIMTTEGGVIWMQVHDGWNIPTGHCQVALRKPGEAAVSASGRNGEIMDLSPLGIDGEFKCSADQIRFVY